VKQTDVSIADNIQLSIFLDINGQQDKKGE